MRLANLVALLVLGSTAAAQQQVPGTCCATVSTDPCCVGQWSGPYHLGISCKPGGGGTPIGDGSTDCMSGVINRCTSPFWWDEIGSAALIPAWNQWEDPPASGQFTQLQGKVLVWTTCDDYREFSPSNGYRTYVLDCESEPVVKVWEPPIHATQGGPLDEKLGITSNGMLWVLDANKNPKLLGLGGTDYRGETVGMTPTSPGMPVAHQETYWFDPLASTPDAAWSSLTSAAFPDLIWYPSLVQVPVPGSSGFFVAAIGGSDWRLQIACGLVPKTSSSGRTILNQYDKWWGISDFSGSWVSGTWSHPDLPDHHYQQYPRTLLKSDGGVLTMGGVLICENGDNPGVPGVLGQFATQQYGASDSWAGGSPFREISFAGATPSHALSVDANSPSVTVGGGRHANAVVMHTLKSGWSYQPGNYGNYELDRIITYGGTMEGVAGNGSDPMAPVPSGATIEPIGTVLEWDSTGTSPVLRQKAAGEPRTFGSFVLLPDGSALAVGGQKSTTEPRYRSDAWRFWPEGRTDAGRWEQLSHRNAVTTSLSYGDLPGNQVATPRGYHSVALLLANGMVALMGGRHEQHSEFAGTNSLDSVEVFKPPYMFETGRLRITGAVGPWTYGEQVEFAVNRPAQVVTACLMGVGAVTHHFDYGQRYVELMWQQTPGGAIKAWVPDNPALIPPGMYLLFVVEERPKIGGVHRVPSLKGRFVKVSL